MSIDLMRESSKQMPKIDDPKSVIQMRIWHCKYRNIKDLREFVNLEELVIASLVEESLDFLVGLERLRYLKIVHMPKINNLDALANLNLRVLSLSTLPTWDVSNRISEVESIDPIGMIGSLENIELMGVLPLNKSLVPLQNLVHLKTAKFSKFPVSEVDRFHSVNRAKNEFVPSCSFD